MRIFLITMLDGGAWNGSQGEVMLGFFTKRLAKVIGVAKDDTAALALQTKFFERL
jgi:hypothetical protein